MNITVQTANGQHTITGPGFYAILENDANQQPSIVDIRYIAGSAFVPEIAGQTVVVSNVATLSAYTGLTLDPVADALREFELFVRVLYAMGVNYNGDNTVFTLHDDMEAGGRVPALPLSMNFYTPLKVFDFMAMTGAILYPLTRFGPNDQRPLVSDARVGDDTVMISTIRKLGIQPFAVHILGEYGIEMDLLATLLSEVMTQQERGTFFYSYMKPVLTQKGFRLLTQHDFDTITA